MNGFERRFTDMMTTTVSSSWQRRAGISIALLLCALSVLVLGTNYYSIFPTNDSQVYRGALAAAFLGAALVLRREESWHAYSQIAYAFFVATMAFFITSLTGGMRDSLLNGLGIPADAPAYIALVKVFEAILVSFVIILLTLLWGQDLGSLYIRKGRLGLGLFIGGSLLTINAATGFITGATLGQAGEALAAHLPWFLLFSLANGFMEELWFRGLFLRRFAAVIGITASILITSFVFTVMHAAAVYMNPSEAILFQLVILPMSLLFAYLMHRTDSIWGSALYHAGSDTFLLFLLGW
jgi:membrane protease YdiL (CAAX protease family)